MEYVYVVYNDEGEEFEFDGNAYLFEQEYTEEEQRQMEEEERRRAADIQ